MTDHCETYLKKKIKGTKEYDKEYTAQYKTKLLDLIRSILCSVEPHLQETRSVMKDNKHLYTFSQISNTTTNDYMEKIYAYIKVINYYGVKTTIQPGIVKFKLTKMGVQDTNNKPPVEKEKS